MDLASQNVEISSDFITNQKNVPFGASEITGRLIVRQAFTFKFDHDSAAGTEIFRLNLDTSINSDVQAASLLWERYSFSGVTLDLQSTSPMGTASGAVQVAHIPDPENTNLAPKTDAPGLVKNLEKLVRQSGSLIFRPRDTKALSMDCNDTLFTLDSGVKRFSSFGAVLAVVREQPNSGDSITMTATFSATINFFVPTIVTNNKKVTETVALRMHTHTDKDIVFKLADAGFPKVIRVRFNKSIPFRITKVNPSGTKYTILKHLNSVVLSRNDNHLFYSGLHGIDIKPTDDFQIHADDVTFGHIDYLHGNGQD
jgi:hypothetical protein